MEEFYFYSMVVAVILLIIILTIFGLVIRKAHSSDLFPPTENPCPDGWEVSGDYCVYPKTANSINQGDIQTTDDIQSGITYKKINSDHADNKKWLGADKLSIKDGNSYPNHIKMNNNDNGWAKLYPGSSLRCAKKNWAQRLNIVWDGVTNYNGCG